MEWQADCFAAYLLMPSNLVRAAWEDWRGNLCPVGLDELHPAASRNVSFKADPAAVDAAVNAAAQRFVRPLAERFEVSAEAMRIRLRELDLLVTDKAGMLFTS